MEFMSAVQSELNNEKVFTENGAIAYRTSGDKLVDFNFAVGSMRKWSEKKISDYFMECYEEDAESALRYLFYLRDRELGLGERRTFRVILQNIFTTVDAEKIKDLIPLVAFFGRWDDLFCLLDTPIAPEVYGYMTYILDTDIHRMTENKSVSLLAKWLPSENASSVKTKMLAARIRKALGFTPKQYRQILSSLRKYLDVVEVKMSANEWNEINYNGVPSKANLKYGQAFYKHDEERRAAYLESLKKNDGTAKINAGVLFPHDIIHKYEDAGKYDETLEQLWKNLPDFVNGASNTLVIRDGSGSMMCPIDNSSHIEALDVATALTIYFSEKSKGQFKDQFITFSSRPQLIDLRKCDTLRAKLDKCRRYNDCSNTDLEATFDLILNAALSNHLKQEELPQNILIVSDMEFDYATTSYDKTNTLVEGICKRFEEHGYKMPKLIFWNVNSRTNGIPLQKNEAGVILVSGFSTAICNMVLSQELDPKKALEAIIWSERYDCISKALLK